MTADSIEKTKQVKKRNVHIVSYEEPESGETCGVVPSVFLSHKEIRVISQLLKLTSRSCIKLAKGCQDIHLFYSARP